MAELAIHDPHYFNVESEQKMAIVHLFHNPIPADGPRDEGPEWAREVDDIYLIGGVGPDGPTVKTVTNGDMLEWSPGGAYKTLTLQFNHAMDATNTLNINAPVIVDSHIIETYNFDLADDATSPALTVIYLEDTMVLKINGIQHLRGVRYNNVPLEIRKSGSSGFQYLYITIPDGLQDNGILSFVSEV